MILTPTEIRAFIDTDLEDPALQILLDATEQIIDAAIGPVGSTTEWISSGSGDLIMLSRRAASITSISEDDDVLAADDYELLATGRLVRRLDTGTNPQTRWRGRLIVTSVTADDLASRKAAQVALVQLALDTQEGGATTSERIGDWAETFATSEEVQAKRSEILSTLLSSRLVML